MSSSKVRKEREDLLSTKYQTITPVGTIIRTTRKCMGLTPAFVAKCLGVSECTLNMYEHNRTPVPTHIIIKLMMFGLDFWCRNAPDGNLPDCAPNIVPRVTSCNGVPAQPAA